MVDTDIWQPRYTLTNSVVNRLMEIEAARAVVDGNPLPPAVLAELSRRARIRATHYSTRIEGNRLTLAEAEEAISGGRRVFPGRERDAAEVRNYWEALSRVEKWAADGRPVTEDLIRRIHAVVMNGKRSAPQPYRTGQNAIRDSVTGALVYLPPEAPDVPMLMRDMVAWIRSAEKESVQPVVVAGLAHYQFVTIHPYYDGNGRTARLLATFILHRCGYGLGGMLSVEEYHSRDIHAYYGALDVGGHHNYYFGRADADLTGWLEYFAGTLAKVFEFSREEAARYSESGLPAEPDELRRLDHRARIVLGLFTRRELITSADVADVLGLSERMARVLVAGWVSDGWLVVADPSRRARKYSLSERLRQFVAPADR